MNFIQIIIIGLLSCLGLVTQATTTKSSTPSTQQKKQSVDDLFARGDLAKFKEWLLQQNPSEEDLKEALRYALVDPQQGFIEELTQKEQVQSYLKSEYEFLRILVEEGELERLKWITSKFDLKNLTSPTGENALFTAVQLGSRDKIVFLLKKYPHLLNQRTTQKESIWFVAARRGQPEIVTLLKRQKNAPPLHEKNAAGKTAAQIALENQNTETAKLLKEK